MTARPERLPGLVPERWSDDVAKLLGGTVNRTATLEVGGGVEQRRRPLHILTVMAHNEKLLGPFIEWAAALAIDGALPRRDAEILALRVATRYDSDFEWGHHIVYGRAGGLTEEEIDRIAAGALEGWQPHEAALVQATDELLDDHDLSEQTWEALRAHYSDAALVEIPFVVGQYTMLSMLANAMGVQLEPGHEPAPVEGRRRL